MNDEVEETWLPDWKPRVRAWLDGIVIFALIFASLTVAHYAFRLFRTLDPDLMEFMEWTHRDAVKLIWVLFLVSQVRTAASEALTFVQKKEDSKRQKKRSR
jgi:hypothetical protein